MRASSTLSERVFVPRTKFSRWALVIWLAQHGAAGAGLAIAGLPIYVKFPGILLLIVCAIRSCPRQCPRLGVVGSGRWSLPDEALRDLQILPGTQFTQWWILMKLGGGGGVHRTLRIWRDAFEPDDWRHLLVRLREYRRRESRRD